MIQGVGFGAGSASRIAAGTRGLTLVADSLSELLDSLDRCRAHLSLAELGKRLESLHVGLEDVRPHLRFSHEHYQRNLLHSGPAYEALILCWKEGQSSPIHDHKGAICGVRVLWGTLTEVNYELDEEVGLRETSRRTFSAGSVCCSEDSDIHEISNSAPDGGDLVTLHIYAPPLATMGVFSLEEPGRREVAAKPG